MNEFYTYFWLAKAKKNKKELCPIYCRVFINGQRTEVCTKVYIKPSEWCAKRQKITSKANEHLNDRLFNIKVGIEKDLIRIEKKHNIISVHLFKNQNAKIPTVLEVYKQMLDEKFRSTDNANTIKAQNVYFNIFQKFIKTNNLSALLVSEVRPIIAQQYISFMSKEPMTNANAKKKIGYSSQVMGKCYALLKQCLEYAYNHEYIANNPLAFFKPNIQSEKTKIVFLEREELARLAEHKFASERLQQVADLFVFQSYTGFAYNELVSFNHETDTKLWNEITFIQKNRGKTGTECLLPFFPQAKAVYEKYKCTLPIITNQRYNAYLKEVCEIVGIKKKLTTHVARKTAAMLFYENGASEQQVARMLGHSTARTTFRYYAVVREQNLSKVIK